MDRRLAVNTHPLGARQPVRRPDRGRRKSQSIADRVSAGGRSVGCPAATRRRRRSSSNCSPRPPAIAAYRSTASSFVRDAFELPPASADPGHRRPRSLRTGTSCRRRQTVRRRRQRSRPKPWRPSRTAPTPPAPIPSTNRPRSPGGPRGRVYALTALGFCDAQFAGSNGPLNRSPGDFSKAGLAGNVKPPANGQAVLLLSVDFRSRCRSDVRGQSSIQSNQGSGDEEGRGGENSAREHSPGKPPPAEVEGNPFSTEITETNAFE